MAELLRLVRPGRRQPSSDVLSAVTVLTPQ